MLNINNLIVAGVSTLYNYVSYFGVGGKVVTSIPSSSTSSVLYNISCPEYVYNAYDCSFSDMIPQACFSHQMDTVVACYEGESAKFS